MISARFILRYALVSMAAIAVAQAVVLRADAATAPVMKTKSAPITSATAKMAKSDRAAMKTARQLFEKKKFAEAIKLYETVDSGSDYWAESLEERAWAHLQLNEHDRSLGLLKTLMAPPLKNEIGPEPYLQAALIQLHLCSYQELFKTLKRFKEDIRPRHEALSELAKTGSTPAFELAMERAKSSGRFDRTIAGPEVSVLPRLFYRDAVLESSLKKNLSLKPRIKVLAAREVKEIDTNLRRLHLIEVEAVQRMHSQMHLADVKKSGPGIERDANTLVFPDDENEVWLDELDKYRVNAKGCPDLSARGT